MSIGIFASSQSFAIIDLNYESIELEKILRDYGNKTALAFSYSSNTLALNKKYTIIGKVETKEEGVELICKRANLQYKFLGNMVVLKQRPKPKVKEKPKQKIEQQVPVKQIEEPEQMEFILPEGWEPSYQGPEFPDFEMSESLKESLATEQANESGKKGLSFVNIENEYNGHQIAVLCNKNYEDHSGRELALLFNNTKGRVKGTQISLFANLAAGGFGNQVSLLSNLSTKAHKGNQVSLVCNYAGTGSGLRVQISAGVNNNKGNTHVQVGGLNLNGKNSEGQYGFVNVNGNDSGKQLGFLNINKGKVSKQFGFFNVADTCDYRSIGLINFIKKGYNRFEIAYSSEYELNTSFRFGHERLYTIIGASVDWAYNSASFWETNDWYFNRGAVQFGFGGSLYSNGRFSFMQELTASKFLTAGRGFNPKAFMLTYGLSSGLRLGRKKYNSTIILGIHLNILNQDRRNQLSIDKLEFIEKNHFQLWDRSFDFWPGLKLGFRF